MKLEGKRVVVVGLALTGVAVAKFLAKRGARVIVTDGKPADKLADEHGAARRRAGRMAARWSRRVDRSRARISS